MRKGFKKFLAVLLSVAMVFTYSVTAFAAEGGEEATPKSAVTSVDIDCTLGMFTADPASIQVVQKDAETLTITFEPESIARTYPKFALIEQTATEEEKDAVAYVGTPVTQAKGPSYSFTFDLPIADLGKALPISTYQDYKGVTEWKNWSEQKYITFKPVYTTELKLTNNIKMFNVASASITEHGTYGDENYSAVMNITMGSDSFGKVCEGIATKATDENAIPIVDRKVSVPVTVTGSNVHLAFWSVSKSKWYNRDYTLDPAAKTVVFNPTTLELDEFDGMTTEEAIANASDATSPALVDKLIETIRVQVRDENTDKYCAIAKAYWDALSAKQKEQVEEFDYFGRDTGDASLDDPLNKNEIGDKELLVVSFGTSFNDSRVATIGGIEKALAAEYTDYSVRRAFTAQIIINHIQARDGEVIDNMTQALDRAVANGVKELVVQPTHLMHGYEYDEMCEELAKYNDKFEEIIIAEPLLNTEADKTAVANAIFDAAAKDAGFDSMSAAGASKDTAFVLMGHGTSHASDADYADMQKIYKSLGYNNVFIATVEGDEKEEFDAKGLTAVKDAIKEAGFKKVVFRPLMVVAGDHANNDMADEDDEEAFAGAFKADGFEVSSQIAGLGELEAVQAIYVAHTGDAIKAAADAKAEELKKIKKTVKVTSQEAGMFLLPPAAEMEVNAYTAESYGFKDEVKDDVSALDVLTAEHVAIFGEEDVTDNLSVSSSGWITKVFGENTDVFSFAINGKAPTTDEKASWGGYMSLLINQAKVADGDDVDFFIYQDTDGYTDNYTKIKCENAVNANENLTVNVSGYCYLSYSSYGEEIADYTKAIKDAQLATVDMETGTVTPMEDAITDEDGNVTVKFAEPGVYYLTAVDTEDSVFPSVMTIKKVVVRGETPLTVNKLDGMMVSVKEAKLIEEDGKYILDFTFGSDSISMVSPTLASKATVETAIPVVNRNFQVEVELDTKFHLARYSAKNKAFYNSDFTVNSEDMSLTIESTKIEVDGFEGLTVEQGIAKAKELASVELCDVLIETIYVHARDENTDMYCAAAKACWDALSDEEKEMVEEGDYFGRDTGDASKDNPRNQNNIGDKELLVVSFGTSFNNSRVATIGGIENALAKAFPEYSVRRAFTAQIIINHIQARDGEVIDNMTQALDRAVANGVKELVVQPTHLMHGYEYDEMCEELAKYNKKFTKITIAEPLLNTADDKSAVAKAIFKTASKKAGFDSMSAAAASKDTAFVFMGHGTSHPSDSDYEDMQNIYKKLGYNNVFIATVEGDEKEESDPKGLTAVKEEIKKAGFTKVVFRPLMVVAGDHANNDMADEEDEESFAGAFIADGFEVSSQIAGLGEIKDVQKLYVAHTCEAIGAHKAVSAGNAVKATCKKAGKEADTICSVCGKLLATGKATAKAAHSWNSGKITKDATCTAKGVKTFTCTVCNTTKTSDIAAKGHSYKTTTKAATPTADGYTQEKCSRSGCTAKKAKVTIAKIEKITLEKKKYTYNGKYKKPAVTVKDSKGNIIKSTNYTVSYSKNKAVGLATATVKFNGKKYAGTMKANFKINPKGTKITSLTKLSKGFKVKWAKQAVQTTGYEIRYSTKKSMKNAKTVKVGKASTVSKKITGLKAKKTYYVQIRTYKTVNSKPYRSAWSAKSTVKTK